MRLGPLAAVLLLAGCRTELRPLVLPAPGLQAPRPGMGGPCEVHVYAAATDLPAGSTRLGWVVVPAGATADESFGALRAAVCARGGNAFSQAHWVRPAGASLGDPPSQLEANAWVEPR